MDHSESNFQTTEDLTDSLWNSERRTITLLEGPPGVGKSTLCQRLVSLWANNNFSIHQHQFDYVFFLKALAVENDLHMSIYKELFPEEFDESLIKKCLIECNRNCLMVIDGLDELTDDGRNVVMKLIEGKCCRGINMILTGRHEALRGMIRYADYHHKIKGFSPNNLKSFIEKYFEGDASEISAKVVSRIESDPNLEMLAANPFTAAKFCFVAKHGDIPSTATEIIQQFIEVKCKLYEHKVRKTDPDVITKDNVTTDNLLSSACLLAYSGVRDRTFEFDEDKVQSMKFDIPGEHLLKSGLLINDTKTQRFEDIKRCYFAHTAFQEFFCAWHIAKLSHEDYNKALKDLLNEDIIPTDSLVFVYLSEIIINTDPEKVRELLGTLEEHGYMHKSSFMRYSSAHRTTPDLLDLIGDLILKHQKLYVMMNQSDKVSVDLVYDAIHKMEPLYPVVAGRIFLWTETSDNIHCVCKHFPGGLGGSRRDIRICSSSLFSREIWMQREHLDRLADTNLVLPWVHCNDMFEATVFLNRINRINVLSVTVFPYINRIFDARYLGNRLKDVATQMTLYVVVPTPPHDDYIYLKMVRELEKVKSENVTIRYLLNRRFAPSEEAHRHFQKIDWKNSKAIPSNTRHVLALEFLTSFHQLYYETCCPY